MAGSDLNLDLNFIGFTFNGYHSFRDLSLYRVSEGSRYNDYLIPNFQDKTTQIPGGDGTYFFESNYTQRTFAISIAFDSLSESKFRQLRQIFAKDVRGLLIFDEVPYKGYLAKVQSPPQIKYICFGESQENRIYKGEGTINFVCYEPYARSLFKFLDEYNSNYNNNKDEWSAASGMKASNDGSYNQTGSTSVKVYNPGDIETDICLFYAINSFPNAIEMTQNSTTKGLMQFSTPVSKKKTTDAFIRINTYSHLLEGCNSSYKLTGSLYNDIIVSGDFFKIPLGDNIVISSGDNTSCSKLEYNFLYY